MKALKALLSLIFTMLMVVSLAYAVEIGPNPTSTLLNGDGPFSVSSSIVSILVSGFGGGTIYYLTTSGQHGVIVVCPGFTGTSSSIS